MDNRRIGPTPPVGGSSLLTIFAVLCLTVFALLSLAAVHTGGKLGHSAAAAVTAYYEADCRAEEILSSLRAGTIPPGVTEEAGIFTYDCPISETQTLYVRVAVEGTDYTILRWQAASAGQWQADETLPVWTGETQ